MRCTGRRCECTPRYGRGRLIAVMNGRHSLHNYCYILAKRRPRWTTYRRLTCIRHGNWENGTSTVEMSLTSIWLRQRMRWWWRRRRRHRCKPILSRTVENNIFPFLFVAVFIIKWFVLILSVDRFANTICVIAKTGNNDERNGRTNERRQWCIYIECDFNSAHISRITFMQMQNRFFPVRSMLVSLVRCNGFDANQMALWPQPTYANKNEWIDSFSFFDSFFVIRKSISFLRGVARRAQTQFSIFY